MNKLDRDYIELLKDIMTNGVEKDDRTGTGTISVFGRQIRHNMQEGFPLLTTKKMAVKTMMTELKWFLKGDTNIKYLVDNGCNIWNGDAYKKYEKYAMDNSYGVDVLSMKEFIDEIKTNDEFADKWGELGPIYGKQWRNWDEDTGVKIDQISNLIEQIKTNPDSRRLIVTAWNPTYLQHMTLPPCHYGFQVYTRILSDKERYDIWFNNNYETGMERYFDPSNLPDFDNDYYEQTPTRAISLMWNQRSVDTFLGLPFNIASYGLLLEIIAKEVNMIPDELIGNLGDTHLYLNHIEQAKEQLTRKPMELTKLNELPNYLCMKDDWECYKPSDFTLDNYQSHQTIKAPLSN